MGSGWQLVVHEEAWDFSETLGPADKAQLKRGLRALVGNPHQTPDAFRRSPADRDYSVKYFGRFRALYWLDSLVQEVRIVRIESVRPR